MATIVLYHANCVDGTSSAAIAWSRLGGTKEDINIEYLPYKYGDKVNAGYYYGKDVYILDVALNEQLPAAKMLEIAKNANKFVWLDHHDDSLKNWQGSLEEDEFNRTLQNGVRKYIRLTKHESGAMISWKFFHKGDKIPHWVKLVDDYDRWVFKYPDTRYFNSGIRGKVEWSFEFFLGLSTRAEWVGLCKAGKILYDKHVMDVINTTKSNAMPCKITVDGKVFFGSACNCPAELVSDVGNAMATENNTFGLCWRLDRKGRVVCGIRSINKYNVARIANFFGGGGHLNAAGFSVKMSQLLEWIIND